ncbi:ABC transporter permease [Colwellia demingiae]|nr:ABC transporter permease [Colwellia demingiae]
MIATTTNAVRDMNYSAFFHKYGMVLILILLFTVLSFNIEGFASFRNIFSILEQVSMFGIIAIGVTFAIVTAGIDLSTGSIVALASVVAATLVTGSEGYGMTLVAFGGAMLVGGFCGLINGTITAYGRIPPFIATLGMMTAARGFAQLFSDGRPVDASSDAFTSIAGTSVFGIPGLVIIYVLVAIACHTMMSRRTFGRHVYAIGGNVNTARICGVNVEITLVKVYVLCGVLAGLAGAMLTSRAFAGNPTFGNMWELDAIAAAVIGGVSLAGGVGSVPMCIVGALIIGVMNKGLNMLGVDPYWQQIIKGMIIIGAVLLDAQKRKKS